VLHGREGVLQHHYLLHFTQNPAERGLLDDKVVDGLVAWLPAEYDNTLLTSGTSHLAVGQSTWRYSTGMEGTWCPKMGVGDRKFCSQSLAEETGFKSIMGFCLDAANNMYISDFVSSETLFLSVNPTDIAYTKFGDVDARTTQSGCPCTRAWVSKLDLNSSYSWLTTPSNGTLSPIEEYPWLCRENDTLVAQFALPPSSRSPPILQTISDISQMPSCSTTAYCKVLPGERVEQCAVDGCHDKDTFQSCAVGGLAIQWREMPSAAVLGGEIRRNIGVMTSAADVSLLKEDFDDWLWYMPRYNDTTLFRNIPLGGSRW
jgi:hypothetical protein